MSEVALLPDNQDVFSALNALGEKSGDFSLQCSDVAGFLNRLNISIQKDVNRLTDVRSVVESLSNNQNESGEAARHLLQTVTRAHEIIANGSIAAENSLDDLASLIAQVVGQESQLRAFLDIIETVGGISEELGSIAKKTRMLGLNAAIEASRGGEEARTFGVVADEIRHMAGHAEDSARTVAQKLSVLDEYARALIDGVESNIVHGRGTGAHIDRLRLMMTDVAALIAQFEDRSHAIARCTESACQGVAVLRDALGEFSQSAIQNADEVDVARGRMDTLEIEANDMFNHVAHAGVPSRNGRYISYAEEGAREVHGIISNALTSGALTVADLFDTDYKPIPASNPAQYMNRFVAFADTHIRTRLDAHTANNPSIVGCCLVDMNGYLPTHLSERSHPQRLGHSQWNLENCRNRQIFMDNQTRRAMDSEGDFFLFTYRQDMGEGQYRALRSVFIPLVFGGRRWGLYELGYLI